VLFGGGRSFGSVKDGAVVYLYGVPSCGEKIFLEFVNPEYFVCADGESPPWLRLWPVYPTTKGLPRSWLANLIHSCATSGELDIEDSLPSAILEKYSFPPIKEAFSGIHSPGSHGEIERARDRLAYQDFFENQKEIAARERDRAKTAAKPIKGGADDFQARFISRLPFKLTESQERAISDITCDMDGDVPMNRLVIGDVGSGKTAVAAAAAARCVGAGHQAAILTPTTILADQFFAFCDKYLTEAGARVAKITGGMKQAERDEMLWMLRDGEIDVLVGTHAMLGERVVFKSLGLLVIDEQQRFGVAQREKLASANKGAHLLMTSATPIPRTLRMALYGDTAYTQMGSRPDKGRIVTKAMSSNHIGELYEFLSERTACGDRCYWVCPVIGGGDKEDDGSSVSNRALEIRRSVKNARVEAMTGEMSGQEKSGAMERFASSPGILVATTVIEVGVDVEGANIIILESASSYGLSQLHQMRGRVGRGAKSGICILLDTAKNLKDNKRLEVLLECDDGFRIAEEDLKSRGGGEYLGTRQHGGENFRVADIARDEKWFHASRQDFASQPMEGKPGAV
jgi:ATP-dependent DNA helicase RecG